MKTKVQLLIIFTALILPFLVSLSRAETVTTKTVTQQTLPPGSRPIDLSNFDLNKDNILSGSEVREMLFKLFDTDNNNIIDSNEHESKSILTVVPMQKEMTITYDVDNDGLADKVQSTTETFMRDTQLSRFSDNPTGLSPHEFLDKTFLEVDADGSSSIDRTEWKNAYSLRIAPIPVQ